MFTKQSLVIALQKNINIKLQQPYRLQTNAALKETTGETNASKEWQQARPFEEVPKDSLFNFIRKMVPGGKYYNMEMTKTLMEMQKEKGDIFMMPAMMGRKAILTTYNPEDFERVFRNEGIWPERPGSELMHHHRTEHRADFFQGVEGLISTQGKTWGTFRSAVNPVLMQPKNVRLYFNKMSEVNKQFVERIKEIRDENTLEVPDNFEEEMNRWTLESVSVVALDKQLGLLKENRDNPRAKLLFDSLNDFFQLQADLEFKPSVWRYIRTPGFKKLMRAFDNIQEVSLSYVNEAIERLEEEAKNGIQRSESEQSVLEKLLKMDKKIAIVMAMDMLMAGVDTTSSTFTAALLCLAKNPEKQEKLREEVMRLLPNKDSEFSEESLKNIPYLRACLKESLRKYPLVIGNARVTQTDCVLSGYRVPRGTYISMIPLGLLSDEKYFERPNEYLPERWLRTDKASEQATACPNTLKAKNPFVYLPFGFGPRMCIGKRIVDMELELGIARVIRNFKIEYNYPAEKVFKNVLINIPNVPLKFKFTDIV